MTTREIPADIWDDADAALVGIVADGLGPSDPAALGDLKRHIATALLSERERVQADVIAAVANETPECQQRVFVALRRGVSQ